MTTRSCPSGIINLRGMRLSRDFFCLLCCSLFVPYLQSSGNFERTLLKYVQFWLLSYLMYPLQSAGHCTGYVYLAFQVFITLACVTRCNPVGAGDRLGLKCPDTGDPLPSAMLPYCGRTMLDLLLRDLKACLGTHSQLLYFYRV